MKKINVGDLNLTTSQGTILVSNVNNCSFGTGLYSGYNGRRISMTSSADIITISCGSGSKNLVINASDIVFNSNSLNTANGLVKLNANGKIDLSLIDITALKAALDALS